MRDSGPPRKQGSHRRMKQLLELLPVALFFITYQMKGHTLSIGDISHTLDGIYDATKVLMAATTLQLVITWFIKRVIDRMMWFLVGAVWVFGGLTLALHNQEFIQWKPTIFNWALGLGFLGARLVMGINLMEKALGEQLKLPNAIWNRLLALWVSNFLLVGALNLVVVYNFSEATWVSYKLWSAIGFTVLLAGITVAIIAPHMQDEES